MALSTTEAEYIAITEAVKEAKWLKGILEDFGERQDAVEIVTVALLWHSLSIQSSMRDPNT